MQIVDSGIDNKWIESFLNRKTAKQINKHIDITIQRIRIDRNISRQTDREIDRRVDRCLSEYIERKRKDNRRKDKFLIEKQWKSYR